MSGPLPTEVFKILPVVHGGVRGGREGHVWKTDGQLLLQMYDCCYRKQDFPVGERLRESGCVAEAEEGGVEKEEDEYVLKWRVGWIKDFRGRAGVGKES